jgi:beta-lactamase class A
MRIPAICVILVAALQGTAWAQNTDVVLQARLEQAIAGFHGTAGVYVRHLGTSATAGANADTLFPTASMVKVPILCKLFEMIDKGDLRYSQPMVYGDSLKYDDGICGSFKDSTKIPLSELVTLMICFSDNTASLWLERLVGDGVAINDWLERNGFHQTRVNRGDSSRTEMRKVYQWGTTTPREMSELVVRIAQGKAVSPSASEEMQRVLGAIHWTREAQSQIPPAIKTLSKQGAVDRSRSEVTLVHAPSGDYVFCVITKNQADTRYVVENEGYVLIRTVSRLLWQYFEPKSSWAPSMDLQKWDKGE